MSEVEPSVLLFAGRFQFRGSCAYTLRLAENLPRRGIRTTVICPDASAIDREQQYELGIRSFPHLLSPLWGHVVLQTIKRQLAHEPPDLIHIQSRHVLSQGLWLAKALDRPYVLTVHDHLRRREMLALDRERCQQIIAVSESVRDNLLDHCSLPGDFVTTIPTGVKCDRDASEIPPIFVPGKTPVVGTAGPLEVVKGFPFFLGAAARILELYKNVEFLVAGAGPEEGNLRRLARQLGINDHVTFAPNLVDFSDALEAMDIFCLPSLQQGLGSIMLEAMALGRPVVASKVGGVDQIVRDDETGALVPPSNSAAMADEVLKLLADPVMARKIGDAGRQEVAQDFSVERMIDRTVEVYRRIVLPDEADFVGTHQERR